MINDTGRSFGLKPTAGEGSLEGGGDYVGLPGYSDGDFNTKIYLTEPSVGRLGCDANDNVTAEVFGDSATSVGGELSVTRIDTGSSGHRRNLHRAYRLLIGNVGMVREALCQLDKTGEVGLLDQLVGLMQVTFEPEASTALGCRAD